MQIWQTHGFRILMVAEIQSDGSVEDDWLRKHLSNKIRTLDWSQVTRDVSPFLSIEDRGSLNSWGTEFFLNYLARIRTT